MSKPRPGRSHSSSSSARYSKVRGALVLGMCLAHYTGPWLNANWAGVYLVVMQEVQATCHIQGDLAPLLVPVQFLFMLPESLPQVTSLLPAMKPHTPASANDAPYTSQSSAQSSQGWTPSRWSPQADAHGDHRDGVPVFASMEQRRATQLLKGRPVQRHISIPPSTT